MNLPPTLVGTGNFKLPIRRHVVNSAERDEASRMDAAVHLRGRGRAHHRHLHRRAPVCRPARTRQFAGLTRCATGRGEWECGLCSTRCCCPGSPPCISSGRCPRTTTAVTSRDQHRPHYGPDCFPAAPPPPGPRPRGDSLPRSARRLIKRGSRLLSTGGPRRAPRVSRRRRRGWLAAGEPVAGSAAGRRAAVLPPAGAPQPPPRPRSPLRGLATACGRGGGG